MAAVHVDTKNGNETRFEKIVGLFRLLYGKVCTTTAVMHFRVNCLRLVKVYARLSR